MAQLVDIQMAQKSLEDCFARRMEALEAQIHIGAPAKETVAKVAEEFRTFRELVFTMLGLLRKQIDECSRMIDVAETRHRRKDLIFLGVAEAEKEDCTATILDIIKRKLAVNDIVPSAIRNCHRLGAYNKTQPRPILVRFCSADLKTSVWKAKSRLKGSPVTVKEFLTKSRQMVFAKARQHFGIRSCWTQDGIIVIKTTNGTRNKITSSTELDQLVTKHPKAISGKSATKN